MFRRLVVGACVLVGVAGLGTAQVRSAATETGFEIALKSGRFDPLAQPMQRATLQHHTPTTTMYIVQFVGPVRNEWKAAVEQTGTRLYDYIPEYSFIARMDAQLAIQVQALPFVRWVGFFHPAERLDPQIARVAPAAPTTVQLVALPDSDLAALAQQLGALGAQLHERSTTTSGHYLRLTLPAHQLDAASAIDGVTWIEPWQELQTFDRQAAGILGTTSVRDDLRLYGANQVIGVADTGLDTGNPATLHPDLRGRLVRAYCLGRPAPCDWSDGDGHGTHVSGSALGNGVASGSNPAANAYNSSFAGTAPQARLVFQSIADAQGRLVGLPNDPGALMRQAYGDGARIHSNSWGGPTGVSGQTRTYGGYTINSQLVDQAAWEQRDQTILFAAGNEGTDRNRNGVVDPDSMAQPGTAKNVITVGASESLQPQFDATWGRVWPNAFGTPPIADGRVADNPQGMAAFSSRGPTDDGRIKPDLVAPGTMIISTRSRATSETGWREYDANYLYMGGTSMATPLVAGGAALAREWLVRTRNVANPSSALVKATLINGTTSLAPGQYGTGSAQEVPSSLPNAVAGWGRLNLTGSFALGGNRQVWLVDNTQGLATNDTATYQLALDRAGAQTTSNGQTARALSLLMQGRTPTTTTPRATSSLQVTLPATRNRRGMTPTKPGAQVRQAGANAVRNGGFENATFAPWETFGSQYSSPQLSREIVAGGQQAAQLGVADNANDQIWQALNIPSAARDVQLSFSYALATFEVATLADFFCVGIWNSDGTEAYGLDCVDAAVRGTQDWTDVTYTLDAPTVAAIRGQTVLVAFLGVTDSSLLSGVWIDDVVLTTGVAAAPPPAPSPTPGPPPPPSPPAVEGALRVTLVWTDPPGSPAAARALVNDLTLEVTGPNGQRYVGNAGAYPPGHPCLDANGFDRCNNVEGVIVPQLLQGGYTVRVRGMEVAQGGRQPFALVASGANLRAADAQPTPPPSPGPRPPTYLPLIGR